MKIRSVASIKTAAALRAHLDELGVTLPLDDEVESGESAPLAQTYSIGDKTIGNRFAILPMEGWDPDRDGRPTELTRRRWKRSGVSGAKLIWGEAVAVRPDARGSPHQLIIQEETVEDMAELRRLLVRTHEERFGRSDDLFVGVQLTHSGRVCRPNDWGRREPKIAYHHPLLDPRFGVTPDTPAMTDEELDEVVQDFVDAAVLSRQAGFDFVDIKHCNGYLGHELLSAVHRPGRYGGSFENRTRFLRDIVKGIKSKAPELAIGVRLSAFDFIPFRAGAQGVGEPVPWDKGRYPYAFGGDGSGTGIDLGEPFAFLDVMAQLGAPLFCMTAGAGHCYHVGGPSYPAWPRAYSPPEDPMVGVSRQVNVAAALKGRHPELLHVASGLSCLQEWLPNVAQGIVRSGASDFIGLGRMALSYPEMASDVIEGKPLKRNMICRTCGACGAAAGNRMPAGCYLLDPFYRGMPEFQRVRRLARPV